MAAFTSHQRHNYFMQKEVFPFAYGNAADGKLSNSPQPNGSTVKRPTIFSMDLFSVGP
jgi:hypothetical protein